MPPDAGSAQRVEVAVVGAGPAGSAAAITLARAGIDCLLLDKAEFPRDKCCGDGLTTGALRLLDELGLDPAGLASFTPVGELCFRAPSGRTAHIPLPGPPGVYGAVARRTDLDAALVELARGAGARLRLGDALCSLEQPDAAAGPLLRLESGSTIGASYVVAADGAWSPTRRLLAAGAGSGAAPGTGGAGSGAAPSSGAGSARGAGSDWHAFRAYASDVSPEAARRLWVWFERGLLPGYAWSFPLAGSAANVGICLQRGAAVRGRELAAAWERVLESSFLRSLLGRRARLDPPRSWPIPSALQLGALSDRSGRVLFAGDAACTADPFTGEGVAQAIESGTEAAEAIASARAGGPSAVAGRYRSAVGRTLARDHAVARACRALMARPLGAGLAVAATGARPWTRSSSARWLFEDWPRGVLLSPGSWRELRRERPGPFAGRASS
ncbi:MAG TPA: FAD-dependent monooxygenase [Acidimicrobiales bacterium]|nr:FAD-dependent monooxygenase [Acidimicrobiales bacterium]